MKTWKLEDAKNQFSELVRRALSLGPQRVTRGGRDAVVVLSAEDYDRLNATRNIVDFLERSPFADAVRSGDLDLDTNRRHDQGRDIDL